MATTTTIARLPGNWDVWEGPDAWPEWTELIRDAIDEALAEAFPGGDIFRVGSEIHGPATIRFHPTAYDDTQHCYRYQRDTPDRAKIQGIERLDNEEWLTDMLSEAAEQLIEAETND